MTRLVPISTFLLPANPNSSLRTVSHRALPSHLKPLKLPNSSLKIGSTFPVSSSVNRDKRSLSHAS